MTSAGPDWRADAYERLTTVVSELESFRSSLRTWMQTVHGIEVTGEAERGRVVARCSGYGELTAITIDEDFCARASIRQLETAITTAVRAAEELARDELLRRQSSLTIFGVSIAEGLAGRPITELLPPPAFPPTGGDR